MVKRGLFSVTNKTGLEKFARLATAGWEIISTGGTAKTLGEASIPVTPIEQVTGFPEMLDGRLKTIHPNVFGGILAIRDNLGHMEIITKHGIKPIDLIVVNLYDFLGKPDIEQIDIGGPSLIRAAAKNGISTIPLVDPNDYDWVIDELVRTGDISEDKHEHLVMKVFECTTSYDKQISEWMRQEREAGRRFLRPAAKTAH